MKKALLIAALAISMNASAQDLPSTSGMQDQVPYVGEIFRTRTEDAGKKTTGIYPHEIFGRTILRPTYEHLNSFQQNDSIYTWRWDTTLIGWVLESKIINMLYDANNNLTFFTSQYWDSTAFVNDFQITRTYDANNNQTSSLYQDWDGSDWVNNNLYTSTYDAKSNLTRDLSQAWNGNAWVNSYQEIYTYDANNNQTSYINKKWGGNTWVNDYQSTRNYDANNNLIFSTYQEWNGSILGVWLNNSQSIYTYDFNNNLTRFFNQNWSGSAWVNYNQIIYTYDLNNNQISYLEQSWHGSTWVNDYQSTHNYDANNFLQSETDKYFDDSGKIIPIGELANWYTDSIHYYFHTITNIDELKAEDSYVSVFPNPSSGKFTLSSKNSISAIEIYNLLGERVYADSKFSQHTSTDIDLSGQGKGIFFINVYTGKLMHSSKVIVQ